MERSLYAAIAERAVLGSALLDNSLMRGPLADLAVEDFGLSLHRQIYAEMLKFSEDDAPFDPSTIAQLFDGQHEYEAISALVDGAVPLLGVVRQHVRTILDCSRWRRLRQISDDLDKSIEGRRPPDEIEACLAQAIQFLQSGCDLNGNFLPASQRARSRTRLLTAVEARKLLTMEIKPREMLLDPILPEQGLVMLYGYRGTGKTFVALGVAIAVITGSQFLGWKAPKPRKVLYVDGELPAKTIQDRIRAIVGPNPAPEGLRIVTPDLQDWPMPDLSTESGQLALEPLLEGIDLVILDNLSALCRSGNENEAEDWLQMQEWMLRLRKRGISVLFLHHSGKNKSQRGTSKREDLLDVVISLKHPSDYDPSEGLRCEIHFEKTRGYFGEAAKPIEVAMREDSSAGAKWTLRSTEDANTNRALELFREGLSVRKVAAELGISSSAAGRLRQKWQSSKTSEVSQCPTI